MKIKFLSLSSLCIIMFTSHFMPMSLICRLEYPSRYFHSHFCFLKIFIIISILLFLL